MRPPSLALALALACTPVLAIGCQGGSSSSSKHGGVPRPPKDYPDGADGLRAIWSDVLAAAQKDDREKVHDLMASMTMTDEDLAALFGARAKEIAPRYAPMISRLVNIGALELVAQVAERKLDAVEVVPADPTRSPEERAVLATLPPGTRVFDVRIKRKADKTGLRYDFFVYRDGHWVTGNLLGKYLAQAPPDAGAADGAAVHPTALPRDGGAATLLSTTPSSARDAGAHPPAAAPAPTMKSTTSRDGGTPPPAAPAR